VSTHEAKTHLSRLITEVIQGEEVVILRGQQAVARLVAYAAPKERRRPQVGTSTSDPVRYDADAFDASSDDELAREWDL